MKSRGTSFYAFPSGAKDMNLSFQNANYKVNFSKVIALNIPQQILDQLSDDQNQGIMNFAKYDEGSRFYNFQPGSNVFPGPIPDKFSDQLVEHLRNYVANYDETEHNSRVNTKNDFYNVNETKSPAEMIFWKWCRKLNLIDWEPAQHDIDWDKNLTDFENPNTPSSTSTDYFQEYLWKEREVINYDVATITYLGSDTAQIQVNEAMKIKNGDEFIFSGTITPMSGGNPVLTGISYEVANVNVGVSQTLFEIEVPGMLSNQDLDSVQTYLDYHRLVVYVGEVQSQANIQTSRKNYNEITVTIPHHAGQTPTVLFKVVDNTNYYPDLELPILPEQIQEEIWGAENLNSPIRTDPQDYPGSYYGYFDTEDKTYKTSTGDKLRKAGPYYGILLSNNANLAQDNYFEELEDFNSNTLDGAALDFDTDHYLKMNLPESQLSNFDEFNTASFDGEVPADFNFNTLLWYYEIDDGSGNITHNLYGIEFLNNPEDDFGEDEDPNGQLIGIYRKLVSNGQQDGLSYIFNLNVHYSTDNDVQPLSYDPTTINNDSAFDLYQNVLQTNATIGEDFLYITSAFTYVYDQLFEMKSLIYSQTDLDILKRQMTSMQDLLQTYSTMQHVDSPTTKVEVDYSGTYPTLKTNVVQTEYNEIQYLDASEIYEYNEITSGESYLVQVPLANQKLLIIYNNLIEAYPTPLKITLDRDLSYAQGFEVRLVPNISNIINDLEIYIQYNQDGIVSEELLTLVEFPTDIYTYNASNPTGSTKADSFYYNDNIITYARNTVSGATGTTWLFPQQDFFTTNDVIYVDNLLYYNSANTFFDYSGAYKIQNTGTSVGEVYYEINLASSGLTLQNTLKLKYYREMKVNFLRLLESSSSDFEKRYETIKEIL